MDPLKCWQDISNNIFILNKINPIRNSLSFLLFYQITLNITYISLIKHFFAYAFNITCSNFSPNQLTILLTSIIIFQITHSHSRQQKKTSSMLESTDQLSLTLNGLSIALVGLLGIYLYRQKITPLDILQDLLIIFKFACYVIYTVSELVFKNFIIPGFFLRKDINGQTVLITGAAGGIGKSLAKKFLGLGAHVVCCDISKSLLNELEAELKREKTSGRIFCYEFDVTSSGEVAEVAQQIRSEVGKVDILVNNAGVQNAKLFLDLTEKDVNRLFG